MDDNPWYVDSIQDFLFFKCPECIFDAKEEDIFHDHAIENHPMSFVLFGKTPKEENFGEYSEYLPLDININTPENDYEQTDIKEDLSTGKIGNSGFEENQLHNSLEYDQHILSPIKKEKNEISQHENIYYETPDENDEKRQIDAQG